MSPLLVLLFPIAVSSMTCFNCVMDGPALCKSHFLFTCKHDNEICKFTHHDGEIKGTCAHHNDHECDTKGCGSLTNFFFTPKCVHCCSTLNCVTIAQHWPNDLTSSVAVSTTSTPNPSVLSTYPITISISASTTPNNVCGDHVIEHHCSQISHVCDNPLAGDICRRFCHLCGQPAMLLTSTTTPISPAVQTTINCVDHNHICCEKKDICQNSLGHALCPNTCPGTTDATVPVTHAAHSTDVTTTHGHTTTLSTTTHVGNTVDTTSTPPQSLTTVPATHAVHSTNVTTTPGHTTTLSITTHVGNTVDTTSTPPESLTTVPATHAAHSTDVTITHGHTTTISPTTHAVNTVDTTSTSSQSLTATSMSLAAQPSTAKTGPVVRSCYQCGDYDLNVMCTLLDVNLGTSKPCPTGAYCMTDVHNPKSGDAEIIKRCVGERECKRIWYEETSDQTACVNYDSVNRVPDLTCHFCCTGDNCNTGIIPDANMLYSP